jgi:hypothetical protein
MAIRAEARFLPSTIFRPVALFETRTRAESRGICLARLIQSLTCPTLP